jgi:hypothetical protein
MKKWDKNACVNYKCAREAITYVYSILFHHIYAESKKERPDKETLERPRGE